jgi:hypothetical protein
MLRYLVAVVAVITLSALSGCTKNAQWIKIDKDAKRQMERYIAQNEDYAGKLEVDVKYGKVTFTIVDTGGPQDKFSQIQMGNWAANKWNNLMKELDGRPNWKADLVFRGTSICHYEVDDEGKFKPNVYGDDAM